MTVDALHHTSAARTAPHADADLSPSQRSLARMAEAAAGSPERLAADLAAHLGGQARRDTVAADLKALVDLAARRHPAGETLVEAFLDMAPAGHRLLASVRAFRSTRLLQARTDAAVPRAWRDRCSTLAPGAEGADLAAALRARCDGHLTCLLRNEEPGPEARRDLSALLELEADARDERVRALAMRLVNRDLDQARTLLARLARLDGELEDLRALAVRLGRDGGREAVVRPANRLVSALGNAGCLRVEEALACTPGLDRLVLVWRGLTASPPAVPDPAAAWRRLRSLGRLPDAGLLLPSEPDPLAMAALVMVAADAGKVRVPLGPQAVARFESGPAPALPPGVVRAGAFLLVDADDACRPRPLALVRAARAEAETEAEKKVDGGRSALRHLVLTNLNSTSVTIAFLRDAKVTSIPGLVQEIVVRTRNPQIIEIIATTRSLHSGFANRGVPLALLKSPVNVSSKLLRKFVHVKYISKIELKRLAVDRTGIRREVGMEIEAYLSSLA